MLLATVKSVFKQNCFHQSDLQTYKPWHLYHNLKFEFKNINTWSNVDIIATLLSGLDLFKFYKSNFYYLSDHKVQLILLMTSWLEM